MALSEALLKCLNPECVYPNSRIDLMYLVFLLADMIEKSGHVISRSKYASNIRRIG